jgi:hypothetical protein
MLSTTLDVRLSRIGVIEVLWLNCIILAIICENGAIGVTRAQGLKIRWSPKIWTRPNLDFRGKFY